MTPREIPQELVDLLDERAGRRHGREGRALTTLADILTRYDAIRSGDPNAQDARALAFEAAKNWALSYPIPAWGLRFGEEAEKLASNWADGIVRDVFDVASAQAAQRAWVAGVRWAAAEADGQAAWREPVYILDITDHLRACADNPDRKSAVARTEAPAVSDNDREPEHDWHPCPTCGYLSVQASEEGS